jgi:hypothetical protein
MGRISACWHPLRLVLVALVSAAALAASAGDASAARCELEGTQTVRACTD